MKLRFDESKIPELAHEFEVSQLENELIELRNSIQKAGYLNKSQLGKVAKWKSTRNTHVAKNSEGFVQEITRFSLGTSDERARIEALTLLDGVAWPMASVILHFYHGEPYPILDFRALESLDTAVPTQYDFAFWQTYVKLCRAVAAQQNVDMRTLDRALWQHSKNEDRKLKLGC